MKKITIKVPKTKEGKWMLGMGARPRSMLRADTLLNRIERQLPSWLKVNQKTAVIQKEYIGSHWENVNETVASTNPHYLIWATACFLENYLSENSFKRIEKIHFEKGQEV